MGERPGVASSLPVRAAGLVAMAGGLAAATLGLLYVMEARGINPDFTENALTKGHYENPVAAALLVGVLAAIAGLHAIHGRHRGRWGKAATTTAFAGVATVLAGGFTGEAVPAAGSVAIALLLGGVVVASVGTVGMGVWLLAAKVLPRWCGAAVILGSPPGVALLFASSTPLVAAGVLPGEVGWALAGVPWLLVGLALLRAAPVRQNGPGGRPERTEGRQP